MMTATIVPAFVLSADWRAGFFGRTFVVVVVFFSSVVAAGFGSDIFGVVWMKEVVTAAPWDVRVGFGEVVWSLAGVVFSGSTGLNVVIVLDVRAVGAS